MNPGWRAWVLGGVLLGAGAASPGCKQQRAAASHGSAEAHPVVTPESDGLLLTWIDDKGDFHVETRVADVPVMGRDVVRVEGQGGDHVSGPDAIFVVDLRQTAADGAYPVRAMTRTDFEAIAVARREKAGPTLSNTGPLPSPSGGPAPPLADVPSSGHAETRAVVTIYGAEWCGACHEAARYLRHKGIAYVEKDVEKDPVAAREMEEKLAKSGLRAGSIPVIDVRGKVMVGFNPAEIDTALGVPL